MGVVKESTQHQVPDWSHSGGGMGWHSLKGGLSQGSQCSIKGKAEKGEGIFDTPNMKSSGGTVNLRDAGKAEGSISGAPPSQQQSEHSPRAESQCYQ